MEELEKFAADVLERFDNPYVDHQVTSIMLNSFPKFQARDLPGVKTFLERKGELPKGLVFGLAAIITYYKGGKREDGAEIVPNDDQKIMDLLKELWATGDTQKVADGVLSLSRDEKIDYEWMRIPHFYTSFYVYQYATGFSSAVAIAHSILKEGAPAVERYKKFLSGGCSDSPVELLKIAGVNLETPAPIESALQVFGEIIGEMETLV